ncbi:ABC transporter ATP-binding protein [Campylobacter troglodytis]|uniref:iron ABC transporter ATP-binding protein n=1 Tax=Campylobacter troglodytis TaxID=654363 RepID=UPI00115B5914|nr:ATP-binding cassette domain-containing protein [Campylobacter troglodytis]TQR61296.1 iron ABC transporter ATP-binding protein [Campylobacter troglodytis]
MIRLQGINKNYGEKSILKDVSLEFKPRAITSLIGANGAGKSTVLSIAARLLKADSGEVFFDNKPLKSYKSELLARKISILKQQNHVHLRLRVKELVAFGRFPYCAGRLGEEDRAKIQQAIEYMGLEDLQDRFLDTLSGGQRQRAFIAMIIAQDTEYVLLDEPLNNLDMKHSVQIMKMLRNLVNDFNKAVVVVLHDINFASVYSDFIITMKDGAILKEDTNDKIIQEDILKQTYDMNINIKLIDDKKICLYYD